MKESLWLEHNMQGGVWNTMFWKSSQGDSSSKVTGLLKDIDLILKARECHEPGFKQCSEEHARIGL